MFFFEKILERISKSKYKCNIILKGGLLLSSIIGDAERTTKDMDATLKSMSLEKENIESILNEILSIDLKDNVVFKILDIKDIREDDEYGGFKVDMMATMENLKVHIAIEITTGDGITPKEIEYNYKSIFENKKISILAYTIETVIAEKYQTIITRGILNTRMKDFYDLYILISKNKDIINIENLRTAIKNTFKHRKTEIDVIKIQEVIAEIEIDKDMKNLWINYQKTATYANRIKYEDLFEALNFITSIL